MGQSNQAIIGMPVLIRQALLVCAPVIPQMYKHQGAGFAVDIMSKILYTSLDEIKSFNPCADGWRNILKGQGKTESDSVLFPLIDCLESNSISDVCWLLGKRKVEIQIAVSFARKCADSVAHLKNAYAANAYAADADAYAAAAYAYAAYAAAAAYAYDAAAAAANAAYTAAYANAAANAAAYNKQNNKNNQFLIDSILAYQASTNS